MATAVRAPAPNTLKNDFLTAITQLSAEKNLPKEVVFEAVEAALASAYKKDALANANLVVKIDGGTGGVRVFAQREVVEEVEDDKTQITLDEARQHSPTTYMGDIINIEVTPQNAGRIAAQTAKQVVLQRLREAEREVVFEEYSGKEGDIISGVVHRLEARHVFIDLGKTEAVLPPAEQVRIEHYRPGQRLKVYLLEVHKANRGPQITVSRTHKNLLKRLFELEVPEINRGSVEIKSIAREAGYRSKVAVVARQEGVDPVGSCVGLRGIRIQNIVNELNGERIDVIQWDPEAAKFVAHALSPAQVLTVRISEEDNTASVIVPDRQLSLAIGKEGQNARLAAKLTGWRIDIKPESVMQEVLAATPAAAAKRAAPATKEVALAGGRGETAEPWMEVVEPGAEEAATGEAAPAEAPAAEPQPAPAAPAARAASRLRFAEDLPPVLDAPSKKDKKTKKAERTPEAEGKAKKPAKRARRVEEEDIEDWTEEIDVSDAQAAAEGEDA